MAKEKPTGEDGVEWLAVIGRSLAFLCLSEADLRDKELAPQANLLQALGLSRGESAKMLGTSPDSLRILQGRSQRKGRRQRGENKANRKP
jgi:hypothetical protein